MVCLLKYLIGPSMGEGQDVPVHADRKERKKNWVTIKMRKLLLTLQPCSAVFIPKSDCSVGTGCAKCTMLLVKAGGVTNTSKADDGNSKQDQGRGETSYTDGSGGRE